MKLRMSQGQDTERFQIEPDWKDIADQLACELGDTILTLHFKTCERHSPEDCMISSAALKRFDEARRFGK